MYGDLYEFRELPLYSSFYEGGWLYQKTDSVQALDVQRGIRRIFEPAQFVEVSCEAAGIVSGVEASMTPFPDDPTFHLVC